MNKPHKHADVIKAWADGAEIEWRENEHGDWRVDRSKVPAFDHMYYEFRVKPMEIPEGFISYSDSYSIPYNPKLKGYEFLLSDGTIEFKESGTGIPYYSAIIAYRPVPNKVVRWQWIISHVSNPSYNFTSSEFLTEESVRARYPSHCFIIVGKAEWTRIEFDK